MRELRVEDALLYLDQVKMEFSDRPHIYNEFLDIMKTFKTQQIDTPGVIRRVSNLFQGNKALVLGFNTFLPEGYKIELPPDGDGQPVAVYRAPGQTGVTHILGPNAPPIPAPLPNPPQPPNAPIMRNPQQQQQQQHQLQQQQQQQQQLQQQHQQQPTISQSQPQQQSRPQFLQKQQHSLPPPSMGGMVEYQQRVPPGPPQQPRMTHPMPSVAKPLSRPTMVAAATSASQPPHPPQQQQPSAQQPPAAKQPVEFDHAINYVTTIKNRFSSEPETYKKFLEILHTYQKEQRGIKEVLDEVSLLFADHPDLLKEFTFFLPDAVQAQAKAQLEKAAKESEARIRANASRQAIMQQAQGMQQVATVPPSRRASVPNAPPQAQVMPQQVVVQQVIAQQVVPQQVVSPQAIPPQAVPSQALPSQTITHQVVPVQVLPPQAAPQSEPSPEPERSYSPTPAPIPFGASQGRSEEREREIIRSAVHGIVSFAPSPPPRRAEISASEAAQKYGRPQIIPDLPPQPTTAEAAFFERAKLHLNRKELAPDKPPGSRRHTPYTEFLKCLHLFGAGILNKDELVLLLKGLFMQGHAPKSGLNAGGGASNPAVANDAQELLREFEEILVGRGHFADQENLLKDKSKYGDKQVRDFDFSGCEKPTPSYRTIPSDYPTNLFHSHSGQSGMDASVLNNTLLCLPTRRSTRFVLSPEEYDGPTERSNIYEENMFKVEDDRYEVDMAIERNVKAMCDVEPIAQEISRLKDQEEKDGQPIGRMQYKLRPRQLKSFHIGAIGRLYGDNGDEVVQHLLRNPIAVLPIVYQRLCDKDSEWHKVKGEMMKKWAVSNEDNYLGSLDVLSFENKRTLGRLFDEKNLVKEIKHARSFAKASNPLAAAPATREFYPDFVLGSENHDTLIYQSYMTTMASLESPHKDAYKLISRKISWAKSLDENLMTARVWAEIIVPFFNYPIHWISDELQHHSIEGKSALIVKYCLGQSVVTAYGKGTIISILESSPKADFRYKISLSYGTAYVRPESILHLAPGRGKFVRQNNRMQASTLSTEGSGKFLNHKFSLMFGNHSMYIFFRMYILLIQILASSKECLEQQTDNDIIPETPPLNNKKFKYVDFLSKLQQVLKKEVSSLDFERACRSASIDKVAQMSVLPKLIEKCANFVCKLSRDPTVFALYDCSVMIQSDPIRLRSCCLSLTENASYRIQYDKESGWIYFSYLELEQDLMMIPEYDEEDDEDEHEEDHEIEAAEEYHDEILDEENDGEGDEDNGEDSDDGELRMPDSKRPKFE